MSHGARESADRSAPRNASTAARLSALLTGRLLLAGCVAAVGLGCAQSDNTAAGGRSNPGSGRTPAEEIMGDPNRPTPAPSPSLAADSVGAFFSHFVGESSVGDTNWIVAVRYTEAKAMILFGYNLGRNTTDRTTPSVVVESLSVRLRPREIPDDNCGPKEGGAWRNILALVDRGPDGPAVRLAWRPSPETGRLIPIAADSVYCSTGGE